VSQGSYDRLQASNKLMSQEVQTPTSQADNLQGQVRTLPNKNDTLKKDNDSLTKQKKPLAKQETVVINHGSRLGRDTKQKQSPLYLLCAAYDLFLPGARSACGYH